MLLFAKCTCCKYSNELIGAQSAGARFSGAQFAGAQFAGAQFATNKFSGAQFAAPKIFRGPICRGPNLPGPNLPGPNLPGPNLPGPNLPQKSLGAQFARGPICLEPSVLPQKRAVSVKKIYKQISEKICIQKNYKNESLNIFVSKQAPKSSEDSISFAAQLTLRQLEVVIIQSMVCTQINKGRVWKKRPFECVSIAANVWSQCNITSLHVFKGNIQKWR